jgi:hypothetical protein
MGLIAPKEAYRVTYSSSKYENLSFFSKAILAFPDTDSNSGIHFIPNPFKSVYEISFYQCCGSVAFWYGSGSADP